MDKAASVTRLFAQYRVWGSVWIPAAAAIILGVLAVRYGLRRAALVLLPTPGAGLALAAYGYHGEPLTLFGLMGLMLVMGSASITPSSLSRPATAPRPRSPASRLSAATTLVLAFGLLSFSAMPALRQSGSMLLIGVAASVLLAPAGHHPGAPPMRLIAGLLATLLLAARQMAPPGCARLPGAGTSRLAQRGRPGIRDTAGERPQRGRTPLHAAHPAGQRCAGIAFRRSDPARADLVCGFVENGALHANLPEPMAQRLDPALLPALIQIAMWPADSVRQGSRPDELELHAAESGRQVRRRADTAEQLVLDISWEGSLPYHRLRIEARRTRHRRARSTTPPRPEARHDPHLPWLTGPDQHLGQWPRNDA